MKIDCVLTSCNLNKKYTDFIPLFIKSWEKTHPTIDIKIVLICDEIPTYLDNWKKYIIQFKEIKNIYSSFISQYIRILYPALLNYKNGIIISDIDMLPMNNKYYIDNIKKYDDNKFITYRNRRLEHKNLVICYNCALSKTWATIFKIKSIDDIINHIKDIYKDLNYEDGRLKKGWYTDQLQLYKFVMDWNKKSKNHIILEDKKTNFNRLCRKTKFTLTKEITNNIKNGNYSEYHAYSPYDEYKEINDNILEIILNN